MMKIQQFSQQGKRTNNEDSLGYSAGLFTVCDGMGGHNYGERASAFVKDAMLRAFPQPKSLGKMDIQQQLNQVQQDLNHLLEKEPELERMGTTFTGVFITPDIWYVAHIGDSRIYLFRPSEQKMWHTWDHSLVGELMRTHEITTEAGRFHPMSNRISKAIIAQKDGKPASASIAKIDELKSGDILLLCSDGVVEAWGDFDLVQLFSDKSLNLEQKCEKLRQQCEEMSKDNNTAIVVEIDEKDVFSYGNNDELDWTSFAEVESDYRQYLKENMDDESGAELEENVEENTGENETETGNCNEIVAEQQNIPAHTKNSNKRWLFVIILLTVVCFSLYFMFMHVKSKKTKNTEPVKTEIKKGTQRNEGSKKADKSGNMQQSGKTQNMKKKSNSSQPTDLQKKEKKEQPSQTNRGEDKQNKDAQSTNQQKENEQESIQQGSTGSPAENQQMESSKTSETTPEQEAPPAQTPQNANQSNGNIQNEN